MTSTVPEPVPSQLIHVAKIFNGRWSYVFLRNDNNGHFIWSEEFEERQETQILLTSQSVEEAMRLATKYWKNQSFKTVVCGFRYTLPERDEHGINALFHQMVASYATSNGIYYDAELGNNCFVQNASEEALNLCQRLKMQNRLSFTFR